MEFTGVGGNGVGLVLVCGRGWKGDVVQVYYQHAAFTLRTHNQGRGKTVTYIWYNYRFFAPWRVGSVSVELCELGSWQGNE